MDSRCDKEPFRTDCIKYADYPVPVSYEEWNRFCTESIKCDDYRGSSFWPQSSSTVSTSKKEAKDSELVKGQHCSVDKLDTEDQRSTSKCAKPVSLSCSQSSSIVSSSHKPAIHSESFKGQQYSFTEPVPEDLLCSICHELLDEPQQTSCGHLFCKKCLDQSKSTVNKGKVPAFSQPYYNHTGRTATSQRTFKCPTCRTTCYNDGFDDKHTDRRVKNLQITCSNTSCNWKGSLCTLDDHKSGRGCKGCQYEPVFCTLGCGEKVIRKDLEHHKRTKCSYRPADCKYCMWRGTFQTLNNHYSTCQKYPLTCPNKCGPVTVYISHQKMEEHLQKCPNQKVKCPYSDLGCNIMPKQKLLDSHTDSYKDYHLQLTMKRVCQLTCIVMEQALDTTNQLSFTHRPWLENTKLFPSMPWIIRFDEFSKKKTQHSVRWTSDPFFTMPTGYKLCLLVYAGGGGEKGRGHISVYTALQRGPNDDILSWPFDKTVEVTLLNQLEDRYHHSELTRFKNADCKNCKIEPGAGSATGWGKSKFISHGDLDKEQFRNCQYLKDDCLFFKVEVE